MESKHTPVKVLLAVGARIYRDATRELLEKFENILVESVASNIVDILIPLDKLSIDLLIIDLRMPGAFEFVTLIEQIKPKLKFITLVGIRDTPQVQKVHNMPGLIGCINDDMPITYLVDRINDNFFPSTCDTSRNNGNDRKQSQPSPVVSPIIHPQCQLTKRQIRILSLIESGHSNKEISNKLNIETCTVKNHVHNILQRLEANSRCEAAAIFRRTMIKNRYALKSTH